MKYKIGGNDFMEMRCHLIDFASLLQKQDPIQNEKLIQEICDLLDRTLYHKLEGEWERKELAC